MALIDHILEAYTDLGDGDAAILGTIVDLKGSGYRRPGARILIDEIGCYIGAISGGCLEKDAARNARRWVADGPQTVQFDTRAKEFHPLGAYGTGCEGIVHLLLQSLPVENGTLEPLDVLQSLRDRGRDGVLVTAYGADAGYDGPLGAIALISSDDTSWCPSFPTHHRATIQELSSECLAEGASRGARLDSGAGELRLLLEYVRPPVELVIVGTGRDAGALVEVASGLDWRIRVVGTDPMALSDRAFEQVDTLAIDHAAELELTPHSYVVQMTHDFELDARIIPHLLDSPAAYIGLLGPRRRTARLLSELYADGRPARHDDIEGVLDRLCTPVGLDLGAEDPYEVAVSIIAEMIAAKNGRTGGALSEREGSIHDAHEIVSVAEGAS